MLIPPQITIGARYNGEISLQEYEIIDINLSKGMVRTLYMGKTPHLISLANLITLYANKIK